MRISANAIDDEQYPERESEADSKLGARVKVTIKDPKKIGEATKAVTDVMKKFNQTLNMSAFPYGPMPSTSYRSQEKRSSVAKSVASTMEGAHSSQEKSPDSKPTWYFQMKEELKKEVIDEVLNKILPVGVRSEEESDSSSSIPRAILHTGIFCDYCDDQIRGVRYKCGNCEDFDLCERCENGNQRNVHDPTHVFLKIRHPSCFFTVKDNGVKKIYQAPHGEHSASKIRLSKLMPRTAPEIGEEYRAKFVCDENAPDGTIVHPGTNFVKIWRVCNTGTKPWTEDTMFCLLWGYQELRPSTDKVCPPLLKSGEEGTIAVSFAAPDAHGHYESYWELHHKGKPFGDTFWCRIRVGPENYMGHLPLNISPNYPQSKSLRFQHQQNRRKVKDEKRKKKESRKKNVKRIMDVLSAVQEDQGPTVGRWKAAATSHTATPNNTPLDLTPPKSPEPREFVVVKGELSGEEEAKRQSEELSNSPVIIEDVDDIASIESMSSFESDSEFVVIPMPKCFSLLNSYPNTENAELHVPKSDLKKWSGNYVDMDKTAIEMSFEVCNNSKDASITDTAHAVENLNLKALREKDVIVSNISVNYSPSSSSISIVNSGSSSPTENLPRSTITVQSEIIENSWRDSASQIPELQEEGAFCSQSEVQELSCTFPKFPLALDVAEHTPSVIQTPIVAERQTHEARAEVKQDGERTIQVLPEGLVTGALLAAATIYNTAKTVITNLQHGKDDKEEQGPSATPTAPPMTGGMRGLTAAEQLLEMGFCNRTLNEGLLKEHKGDVARVVAELVNLNDNDWYASRHSPSAPPTE